MISYIANPPVFSNRLNAGGMMKIKKKQSEYLDEYFKQFMEFLDRVLNKHIRYDFKKEICDFINLIIPGLYSLKLTYPDSKELCCKVDSIILTMLDFKSAAYKN